MARGGLSSARGRVRRRPPARRQDDTDDEIPEVYREMLAEADARAANQQDIEDRPIKRRRVGERRTPPATPVTAVKEAEPAPASRKDDDNADKQVQTVYDLDASDDDSDMEWEEVEIHQPSSAHPAQAGDSDEPIQITLNEAIDKPRKAVVARRKPASAAEKKLRLDIHKVHVLCLLSHVHLRNLWCNDEEVQKFLKQMLSKQTIAFLNPKESMSQFTRSTTFIDGLKQASEAFSRRFKETILREAETITSKEDFRKQAKTLQGSRDFGAQLFCALLRSVSVETRLVCSLQPLPFSGVAKGMTPVKQKPEYIVISSDDHASSSDDVTRSRPQTPPKARRLGQPQFSESIPRQSPPSRHIGASRNLQTSPYPVFWVEAFNQAVQKWIPVDPLVTKSVAKASKFEPPAGDRYNGMSYVVAFEEDASARDVTQRYAKAYNAKTRKNRVESTKDGENWWTNTMKFFEKPFMEDRDQLEISELTAKTAAEPMPKNIQDFKDHPIYALERHLRRNEVIHPKRVIGHVSLSKSGSKKDALEPVYRRADVHVVRSADGWYRLGRDIKMGEQPLKRVKAVATARNDQEDRDGDLAAETPMYAFHQTELYQPPPVVKGKVPKNAYGNLDVYVPSMVPPGAFHLKHPDAARAARLLGIDYADAVTGFEFKGRHGTAVFNGIVAATQYREALEEVIKCIEEERIQEELDRRSAEALRLWKHFLLKLRIAEKVKSYTIEGEEEENQQDEKEHEMGDVDVAETGGGFLPDSDQKIAEPTSLAQSTARDESLTGNDEQARVTQSIPDSDDAFGGGGFLPEPVGGADSVSSNPVLAAGASPRPKKTAKTQPRYTLVVVPNDQRKDETAPAPGSSVGASASVNQQCEVLRDQHERSPNRVETSAIAEGSSEAAPIMIESSAEGTSKSASVEVLSRPPSAAHSRAQSPQHIPSDDDDSNLEQRSLLSHDPEDEDAEPEWLLSD
ncbi:DNA repair protein Rad4 [Rasamsonia emersonii CBS 393.64]|uniref:DNA repair protein Rad4 n=1 Tax=Rasamsonia emersonii (strain ATCC 16479 / CBS 393.64 / IMI 116815) TaxID=1408163 RepID=A0A0F4Z183_RASE3|nr:DNA repair protein Rad4 [Rasamsonia emersonii CBS 393.64]KKA24277.1 DNA repair protein Rad4 [Rasamsonia emersonii CBS 393.64]